MGISAKISSKYQVSIPKEVRDRQGWKPGQELMFVPRGDNVVLVPLPERDDLFGVARGAKTDNYRDRDDPY